MSRSARMRLLVPIAVCSLFFGLAACGDDKKDASSDASSSAGKPPTELVLKVLKEGTGETVKAGEPVTIEYQGTIWNSGKMFQETYGNEPYTNSASGFVPGFSAAIVGQKVGAQVVVGIPPEFGYGEAGQSSAGISGTDTLVFVVEIKAAGYKLTQCDTKSGNASESVDVTGAFGKKAKATFAKPLKAPSLQRSVVKAGTGPKTKAGDNVSLFLAIYNGRTGKQIEASPGTLTVGDIAAPKEFLAGMTCVKVGSRVVTVFPAKSMFGAAGNPTAGIKPNDSLVLVTDLIKLTPQTAPAELPETHEWTNPPTVTFNGTESPTLTLPKD